MPVTAFGLPAWVDTVLPLIENRVARQAGFDPSRVFSYLGDPAALLKASPAPQFVAVVPDDFPVDQAAVKGGGAEFTLFAGRFRLNVFTLLGTDRELADSRLMRDRSFGAAAAVRRVAKAVQVWVPYESDGTSCRLVEPARLVRVKFNPRTPPTGWSWAEVIVEAKFRTDFTTAG